MTISLDNEINIIASNLPNGEAWKAKSIPTTNMYKLIKAFATVSLSYRQFFDNALQELDIIRTNQLIELWEKFVGLPNQFFTQTTGLSLPNRIRQVIIQLCGFRAITQSEVIGILTILFPQYQFSITTGNELNFPYTFPMYFFNSYERNYVVIINILIPANQSSGGAFPYTFPFILADNQNPITEIENFILAIVPFNVNNVIINKIFV